MRDPDYVGMGYAPNSQDEDSKSSLFLYYFFRKGWVADSTRAVILDSLGLATVDNAIITPDKIDFTKEYLPEETYCRGRVDYRGIVCPAGFKGNWVRIDDGHKSEGSFIMENFVGALPHVNAESSDRGSVARAALQAGVNNLKKKLEFAIRRQDRFRNWLQIE